MNGTELPTSPMQVDPRLRLEMFGYDPELNPGGTNDVIGRLRQILNKSHVRNRGDKGRIMAVQEDIAELIEDILGGKLVLIELEPATAESIAEAAEEGGKSSTDEGVVVNRPQNSGRRR